MADKIYVGNGTEKFDGDVVSFSVNLTKVKNEATDFIFDYKGEKFVRLDVCKKRNGADEYGKTHYVAVNTFDPTKEPDKEVVEDVIDDDLPF